jgi:hypothetical protein
MFFADLLAIKKDRNSILELAETGNVGMLWLGEDLPANNDF